MSVQTDPVPPVPDHTPVLRKDERAPTEENRISHPWSRWFLSLREKINVLNESLVSLGDVVGTGILSKDGAAWFTRTIQGSAGDISVANGNGVSGNPVIDLINTSVTPGSYVLTALTVDANGRLTAAVSGSIVGGTRINVDSTNPANPIINLTLAGLVNAVDDTAAASAGVPISGMYRNGSVLMVRVS